jgi:hypothetical protein
MAETSGVRQNNIVTFTSANLDQNNYSYFPALYARASVRVRVCVCVYRVSQEECARLREGVPYVKVYRYNPKHLCPKLNGYGDNG